MLQTKRMWQKGVSGNQEDGCDAIIVGERKEDICLELDELVKFVYVAEIKNGAFSILKTALAGKPIRVFRSSASHGRWQVQLPQQDCKNKSTVYRYEGLYTVSFDESHFVKIRQDSTLSFYFHFQRVSVGDGNLNNKIGDEGLQNQYHRGCTVLPLTSFVSWGKECDEQKIMKRITYGELLVRTKAQYDTPDQNSNALIFRLLDKIKQDESHCTLRSSQLPFGLNDKQNLNYSTIKKRTSLNFRCEKLQA